MFREEAQLEGFRKGRAPRHLIQARFEAEIESEALQAIIEEYYRQAIRDTGTRAIEVGQIENLQYKRGEPVAFDVVVEILPEYTLDQYKGLKVQKEVHRVTDGEIETTLLQLRQNAATAREVETVAAGNEVTCDIQVLDPTDVPIIGKRYTDRKIPLTTRFVGQDFIDGLVGAAAGDTRTLHVQNIGKQSEDEEDIKHFAVTVRKIEEIVLPEADDEFAKDLGAGSLEELKGKIRNDLEHRWAHEAEHKLHDRLVDALIQHNDLPAPEALVRASTQRMIRLFQARTKMENVDESYLTETFRPRAIRDVKWSLARRKIQEQEQLRLTDEDFTAYREHMALHNHVSVDKIQLDFKSDTEKENFEDYLLEQKMLKFLEQHAVVEEVEEALEPEPVPEEARTSLII